MPSTQEIIEQSKSAYGQWAELWRKNAAINGKLPMKSMITFQNLGIGKAVLAVANGYSLEENIDIIRENQEYCDIFVVDKSLKHLIKNDITPQYCIVCDSVVDHKAYLDPVKDKLQDTILFMNVCANPEWTKANWKDIIFYVNKDVLKTEQEFMAISGCQNTVPAATNVSNNLLVMLNQSDNDGKRNFFGYDKILLIGYDYCWSDESYYAFDRNAEGKHNYMRNVYCWNENMDFCFSSSNLLFSARWMEKYITAYSVNAVQCTKKTLLRTPFMSDDLGKSMKYNFMPEHSGYVEKMLKLKCGLLSQLKEIDSQIKDIGRQHYLNFIREI